MRTVVARSILYNRQKVALSGAVCAAYKLGLGMPVLGNLEEQFLLRG